ncbi:MAG TPA: hypothetical protein VF310_11720 [Vicinamibacteria bacterium]
MEVAAGLLLAAALAASDGPLVEHQQVPCTVPEKPFSLCASISDDVQVAKARVYFRPEGERYYSFVDMSFGGLRYCGTVPAPRAGKVKRVEYYVQGLDSDFNTQRTSSYWLSIVPDGTCDFPPVETDPARLTGITVYATHKKQGRKLPDAFQSAGVTFVPVQH